jgi:hypothetical protein
VEARITPSSSAAGVPYAQGPQEQQRPVPGRPNEGLQATQGGVCSQAVVRAFKVLPFTGGGVGPGRLKLALGCASWIW